MLEKMITFLRKLGRKGRGIELGRLFSFYNFGASDKQGKFNWRDVQSVLNLFGSTHTTTSQIIKLPHHKMNGVIP
jgi:hypothetical protein